MSSEFQKTLHTHIKKMQMNRKADRDSGNRRLDVVRIRNPNKAVGEWKRQMI